MLQFWMAANKLTINPHKSQIIVINPEIRTVIPKFLLSFGDTLIYAVKTTKYLGIEIDDQLNFLLYIQKLQKKTIAKRWCLHQIKHCFPESALIALYYGIVFAHLLYDIIIWGSTYTIISTNYKLYRIKLSGQSVIQAGAFMLHSCIMNIKSSQSMTYVKLNLPKLCRNTSTKNFAIIF